MTPKQRAQIQAGSWCMVDAQMPRILDDTLQEVIDLIRANPVDANEMEIEVKAELMAKVAGAHDLFTAAEQIHRIHKAAHQAVGLVPDHDDAADLLRSVFPDGEVDL